MRGIKLDDNKFEKTFKFTVKVEKASGPDGICSISLKLCEVHSFFIKSYQKEGRLLESC